MMQAYEFIYGVQEQVGTSDPDSEPRQHYEVHCGQCGWWGMLSQLRAIYNSSSDEPEPVCPMCLSDRHLEFEE